MGEMVAGANGAPGVRFSAAPRRDARARRLAVHALRLETDARRELLDQQAGPDGPLREAVDALLDASIGATPRPAGRTFCLPSRASSLSTVAAPLARLRATAVVIAAVVGLVLLVAIIFSGSDLARPVLLVGLVLCVLAATQGMRALWAVHEAVARAEGRLSWVIAREGRQCALGKRHRAAHPLLRRAVDIVRLGPVRVDAETLETALSTATLLVHPNAATLVDHGGDDDGPWIAIEAADGPTLREVVALTGPMPARRVVHILTQLCDVLDEAHALGLVHGALSPDHVLLGAQGNHLDIASIEGLGVSAVLVGDAHCGSIAPERQRTPDAADPRSDLWSLGALAFHLLTGREAFPGEDPATVRASILASEPPRPSALKDLPSALDDVVVACLAQDPADRASNAEALRMRLDALGLAPWTSREALLWWKEHSADSSNSA